MGLAFIGAVTKGFTGLTAAANPADIDPATISPALQQLLAALKDVAEAGQPVEVNIVVKGKESRVFTVSVDNAGELEEILQWTVGR
ncbi:hypothetical protein [Xanthobacter versatilis]|uniref:hypothetical protein n=1 Tax=Xanthobacter autotrophicus (strain ATCC BAA-1158 / Py2) TaxID=78245 RepID=UPI0037295F29